MEIDTATSPETSDDNDTKSLLERSWLAPSTPEERAKLREHNLNIFKQKYRVVYDRIAGFEPRSELVFNDDGQPDMVFADTLFYDNDIEGFTDRQSKQYWRNPNRLSLAPPSPQTVDTQVSRGLHSMLQRMNQDEGIEFSVGRTFPDSFYGIVMGIGLGRHIPQFMENTKCRNLFLLEPNMEGFYHSLEIIDWGILVMEMQERNGDIFFFIGGTAQDWMDGLRYQTRATNPNSLDGTYVYAHYTNPLFVEFSAKFNKESQFLLTGLGFFYDEQIMLRNTYHNMSGHTSRIYLRAEKETVQPAPAIIVGCGPSLDKNIEDIKRMEDRAVIFSCGSALGPLMDAGIRPDFQLELENIDVMRVMEYAAENHDLSGICLVCSSTVERRIKDFFEDVVYYFRPALCPYPIFSNNPLNCLQHPDPTVVNVGLSFAHEMGFREYYFFGTDLGQKDSEQHHAKSSFHYSKKAKNEVLQVFNIEVPANFGGKAKTSSGLFWALDTVQRCIQYAGAKCRFYNCSNGVRINRATPKLSRTLDLPELETPRADTVRAIIETFPEMTEEEFAKRWQPERMIDGINAMLDEVIDIINNNDLIKNSDHMIAVVPLFYSPGRDVFDMYAGQLLRGSINQILIAADYYLARITDEEKFEIATTIVREEMLILFERMREITNKYVRALSNDLELREEYLRGDDDDDGLTDEQRELLAVPLD